MDPQFHILISELADETHGKAVFAPGLKGRERANEKIKSNLNNDPALLLDVERASIEYNTVNDMYNGLSSLEKKVTIVAFKDRFLHPKISGYRDILLDIKLSNGLIAEIQLNLAKIIKFKEGEHKDYEVTRSIIGQGKIQHHLLTAEETNKIQILQAKAKLQYDKIFCEALH
jgi:ribosomal protein L21